MTCESLHGTLQIWICSQCIVLMYEQKGVNDPSCLSSSMQGHSKLCQMMKQEKTDEEHRGAQQQDIARKLRNEKKL